MLRFPYMVIRGKLRGEWYVRGIRVASMWPYADFSMIRDLCDGCDDNRAKRDARDISVGYTPLTTSLQTSSQTRRCATDQSHAHCWTGLFVDSIFCEQYFLYRVIYINNTIIFYNYYACTFERFITTNSKIQDYMKCQKWNKTNISKQLTGFR